MSRQADTQTLVESFCTLADEVQNLIDRKTILEHKLRFAAEQYQQLADKYAPTASEVSETLANLQVPPDDHRLSVQSTHVPLPKRGQAGCNQHQIALLIRDGRRAAQQLAAETTRGDTSGNANAAGSGGHDSGSSCKETASGTAMTSMSIVMEQDFTVQGKKGVLDCPFSAVRRQQQLLRQQQQLEQENQQLHITGGSNSADGRDDRDDRDGADTADIVAAAAASPNARAAKSKSGSVLHGDDPICAALAEESDYPRAPSSGGAAQRCPIRFLDQHSPEEVAHYVETHKHELPRSHAICLRRYNKNEQEIRKMDAKYGNLVNMISGLGQFHQPMLASADLPVGGGGGGVTFGVEEREAEAVDRATLQKDSNERVKTWAHGVSVSGDEDDGRDDGGGGQDATLRGRRRSVNESSGSGGDNTDPGRESHFDRPLKEVRLGESPSRPWGIAVPITSIAQDAAAEPPLSPPAAPVRMPSPVRSPVQNPPGNPPAARKCPFDHGAFGLGIAPPPGHAPVEQEKQAKPRAVDDGGLGKTPPLASLPHAPTQAKPCQPFSQSFSQPTFVNVPQQAGTAAGPAPQMVFTGPVFIGYPMEQAAQFLQLYHNAQGSNVQGR